MVKSRKTKKYKHMYMSKSTKHKHMLSFKTHTCAGFSNTIYAIAENMAPKMIKLLSGKQPLRVGTYIPKCVQLRQCPHQGLWRRSIQVVKVSNIVDSQTLRATDSIIKESHRGGNRRWDVAGGRRTNKDTTFNMSTTFDKFVRWISGTMSSSNSFSKLHFVYRRRH